MKIGVIGAAAPTEGYSTEVGEELGRRLRVYIGDRGFIFSGGVSGVGVDVYRGVVKESHGQEERFFVLLPEGMRGGREYSELSPAKSVQTANIGEDMFERRIGMGKVSDALIVLNGRYGTLHEALSALENGRKVVALNYGGAGSLLYQAKTSNALSAILIQEGFKQRHLEHNIVLSDIAHLEEALGETQIARPIPSVVQPDKEVKLPFSFAEVKAIFKAAIAEPSEEEIVSVIGRNAISRWYSAVRSTVQAASSRPLTVYYPGAGADIIHPLLATDADRFIFVDVTAAPYSGSSNVTRIIQDITTWGGKIVEHRQTGANEHTIKFVWRSRERTLQYYFGVNAARDSELPQVVKDGFEIYVEKSLLEGYGGVDKDQILPTSITYLREGGFLLTDYSLRNQTIDERLHHISREWIKTGAPSQHTLRYLSYVVARPNTAFIQRQETATPRKTQSEVRYAYDPSSRHHFSPSVVAGMGGKVYAFDLSLFAEVKDGKVQINSTTFHTKLEELVRQLQVVFGETWQEQVKIVLVGFRPDAGALPVLEDALRQLAPDIAYDQFIAVDTVEQLVQVLERNYGAAVQKTIVLKDTHVQPPGRNVLPELTQPDKPIQIIVVNSPTELAQMTVQQGRTEPQQEVTPSSQVAMPTDQPAPPQAEPPQESFNSPPTEILSGGQAVVLSVEPEVFQEDPDLNNLVEWERWNPEKRVGVLELEVLPVTPEFGIAEEMERRRLEERLSRSA